MKIDTWLGMCDSGLEKSVFVVLFYEAFGQFSVGFSAMSTSKLGETGSRAEISCLICTLIIWLFCLETEVCFCLDKLIIGQHVGLLCLWSPSLSLFLSLSFGSNKTVFWYL